MFENMEQYRCPICQMELVNFSGEEFAAHIRKCMDENKIEMGIPDVDPLDEEYARNQRLNISLNPEGE